jgi:hypothetical protein
VLTRIRLVRLGNKPKLCTAWLPIVAGGRELRPLRTCKTVSRSFEKRASQACLPAPVTLPSIKLY